MPIGAAVVVGVGTGVGPAELPGLVLRHLLGDRRSRAHQAHLAQQDVHELRDLVDARHAQEAPDARHARIAVDLEHRAVALVQVRETVAVLIRVVHHRAELQERERPAAPADPRRAVEHGSARLEPDRDRGQQQGRKSEDERRRRADHVQDALAGAEVEALRRAQIELHDRCSRGRAHPRDDRAVPGVNQLVRPSMPVRKASPGGDAVPVALVPGARGR